MLSTRRESMCRPPARHRSDIESDAGRDPPPRRPGSSRPPRPRPGAAPPRCRHVFSAGASGGLRLGGGRGGGGRASAAARRRRQSSRKATAFWSASSRCRAAASCDACTLCRRARDGCDGGSSGGFSAGDDSSTRCSRARSWSASSSACAIVRSRSASVPANAAPRSSTSSSTAASAAFVRAAIWHRGQPPKTSRCWSGVVFVQGGVGRVHGAKKTGRFESIALTTRVCTELSVCHSITCISILTGLEQTLSDDN